MKRETREKAIKAIQDCIEELEADLKRTNDPERIGEINKGIESMINAKNNLTARADPGA